MILSFVATISDLVSKLPSSRHRAERKKVENSKIIQFPITWSVIHKNSDKLFPRFFETTFHLADEALPESMLIGCFCDTKFPMEYNNLLRIHAYYLQ